MSGYTNYSGRFLSTSAAYTRQIWATGTDALYAPDTPTMMMGSNQGNFLQGGRGDDTLYVIHTGDRIAGGAGVDTAYATVNFTLPADVENLTVDARWSPVLGIANDAANIVTAVNANVTIEAKGGDDVIVSAGGDTFIFGQGSGHDILINFHADTDTIRLSGYDLPKFKDVKAAMTQVGSDTLLTLSPTDSILFKDTRVSDFKNKDFQLSVNPAGMKATFVDDFDSLKLKQAGDAKGWTAVYDWDRYNSHSAHTISGEAQIYVDPTFGGTAPSALGLNPFSIDNGVLTISADKTPEWAKSALWGHDYTSGVLTTAGTFSQTYGYFEMRAQLPSGQGAFPAFWLLSEDGQYNEIDVMETVNGSDQVWNHIHYHQDGQADRAGVGYSSTTPGLTSGFHTFGLRWTSETLTWYVDGAEVASTATPAALNGPMYMLVNYAVGGSWAGAPSGELGDMKIDYVRAYSLDATPATTPPATTPPTPAAPSTTPTTPAVATGTAGTSANDTFTLASDHNQTFTGYDAAGQDHFAVPVGAGGFSLAGAPTGALTLVEASGWWNNISGAQVIRWTGDPNAADSAAKVNGLLQSMPGNQGGGVLLIGYTADHKVGVYYDADAGGSGNSTLVATLDNLTDTHALNASDFLVGSSPGAAPAVPTVPATTPPPATPQPVVTTPAAPVVTTPVNTVQTGAAVLTGTAGSDTFVLSPQRAETVFAFDVAGNDVIGLPAGFKLGAAAVGAPTMVDASAWWNNISGAHVIRWMGDAGGMDSAAEVDAVLESMPGNGGGGAFVAAYTADHKVGVYYDSDPAHRGTAVLVATIDNLSDTHALTANDFIFA